MNIYFLVLSNLGVGNDEIKENALLDLDKTYFLRIPTLRKLGIYKCCNQNEIFDIIADYAVVSTKNVSVFNQHRLMFGCQENKNFDSFVDEIPNSVLNLINDVFRCKTIYNKQGSLMPILNEYGFSAQQKNVPIAYFRNGESEINFAVHEQSLNKEIFFENIQIFAKLLKDYNIQHINGYVFAGEFGKYYKTQFKKEINVVSNENETLKSIKKQFKTIAIGKVLDFFDKNIFDEVYPTKADDLSLKLMLKSTTKEKNAFIYVELNDLDKVYLKKGDLLGARMYLENFDSILMEMINKMKDDDKLIVTSTTDNNQNAPLIIYSKLNKMGKFLGYFNDFQVINDYIQPEKYLFS